MNWPLPPVLVVDDEKKNMRLSLKSILVGEGYYLRLVESAEEALGALEKEEFLMVITDARLGSGMSGLSNFLRRSVQTLAKHSVPDDPPRMRRRS